MANNFEVSAFGSPNDSNVASDVSMLTGPYNAGGIEAIHRKANGDTVAVLDFNENGPLNSTHVVPVGAQVTDVYRQGTTGTAIVKVASLVVTAALQDDDATWKTIVTAGTLTCTGVTAGQVIVTYRNFASQKKLNMKL